MELRIEKVEFPKAIEFNYEELKKEITAKAELYRNMVFTDDTIKDAKTAKADLNKLIAAVETARKREEKRCLQPYEEFEKKMKDLVAIIAEPVQLIDSQVKSYEEKQKQAKLESIVAYFDGRNEFEWLRFEQISDPRWLNATFAMKKVIEAIEEKIGSIKADLETLNNLPEFSFEAIEEYKRTLDINKAIAEGQRLVDIQKRKEAAAAKEVPDERVAEEPAGCAHDDADKQWIGFEALLSIEDAKELRAFFNRNAINFRML
ncbi:DUF1351 domain-containing protein [Emergencia sp. 1XD21-10]|uniref:DUF1351 domain-containing protein n=1 Tax=Emergencia sp. 1XD21-10 TaxID=2304569 RepID=UPI00137A8C4D|nr:DUF1351 domain-containing protein [Emergencia sp. 1XD21-10]NCE98436.1 DUF1351 domain-containing protein [Emergencia sp. 1XD21-10]